MERLLIGSVALVFSPVLVACSGSTSTPRESHDERVVADGGAQEAPADGGSSDTPADAGSVDDGYGQLITGDWTLPPGKEGYFCSRKTVDEDFFVNGFDAIAPLGTHHTLLTMG